MRRSCPCPPSCCCSSAKHNDDLGHTHTRVCVTMFLCCTQSLAIVCFVALLCSITTHMDKCAPLPCLIIHTPIHSETHIPFHFTPNMFGKTHWPSIHARTFLRSHCAMSGLISPCFIPSTRTSTCTRLPSLLLHSRVVGEHGQSFIFARTQTCTASHIPLLPLSDDFHQDKLSATYQPNWQIRAPSSFPAV